MKKDTTVHDNLVCKSFVWIWLGNNCEIHFMGANSGICFWQTKSRSIRRSKQDYWFLSQVSGSALSPGTHLPDCLWAHDWNLVKIIFFGNYNSDDTTKSQICTSPHNSSVVMKWINNDLIWSLIFIHEQDQFLKEVGYELMSPFWNGPLGTHVCITGFVHSRKCF